MSLIRKMSLITFAVFMVGDCYSQALGKEYGRLLKQQGYTPLKAPRSDFGPGSLVPVDQKKNVFIATQAECFPDLDKQLSTGTTKLIDSKTVKSLAINASANYSPTGTTSFLGKLAAAFGFTSKATMDISFGDTSALNLTAVGLQNYLIGHKVSAACQARLRDPKTAVIFSVAKVASMTYTFSGQKTASGSVNATIDQTITTAGDLKYDKTTDNSIKITTPLFVGYNAFSLRELAIDEAQDANGAQRIASVKVVKLVAGSPLIVE